ncbi:MAG: glycosyltransferase family 4 protein [Candidatus Saccharibacteria bacterium]
MKIGIEAERANLPNPTGVERYAAELIRHLAETDRTNEYVLYFRTKPQAWFHALPPNFRLRLIPFPKFWTQIRLSWEMLVHPVDVLMILASALPFYHPRNSVVTVHDVAFEMFPEAFTGFMRRYLVFFTRFAVKRARRIVAVSESTKRDLMRLYGCPKDKIEVIHLGRDEKFSPVPYADAQAVLDKHGLIYKKYILFVGTLQPRKNIARLVEAFIKLRKENRIEEKLVIIGGRGWLWKPILEKIQAAGLKDAIQVLGYVEDGELPAIYSGASLLTLPALYEGFGLPPLEAMACGTPVVVSNVSSLPEVAGEAGVLVDPLNVNSIAGGLLRVLIDPELKKKMSAEGLKQAERFSWDRTAKKTLELLESLK